jgi:hypothetical protein
MAEMCPICRAERRVYPERDQTLRCSACGRNEAERRLRPGRGVELILDERRRYEEKQREVAQLGSGTP